MSRRMAALPMGVVALGGCAAVTADGSSAAPARRIVSGDEGSRFYTADHYSSFREVVSG